MEFITDLQGWGDQSGRLLLSCASDRAASSLQASREACPDWVTGIVTKQPRLQGGDTGNKKASILGAVGGVIEVASSADLPEAARSFLAMVHPKAAGTATGAECTEPAPLSTASVHWVAVSWGRVCVPGGLAFMAVSAGVRVPPRSRG